MKSWHNRGLNLELSLLVDDTGRELSASERVLIRRLYLKPNPMTWADASLVRLAPKNVSGEHPKTLWQLVTAVDPACPKTKPSGERWEYFPSRDVLMQALALMTH